MNTEINEVLAARINGRPGLISNHARELLNLRRLPAMLNMPQVAVLLGFAEHDIPVLVRAGFLQPLGDPPINSVKSFSTVRILELAGESAHLSKMRAVVYRYWQNKNATSRVRIRQIRSVGRRPDASRNAGEHSRPGKP